jgi:uncharacterized repeat protein (TIGR01451 family)
LLPRDIDGDGVVDAYYDTALNITWLADWNAGGQVLTWDQAVAWAASLNVHGVTGWRLPSVVDTGNPGCDFSAAGGTDCGYNVDTHTSELARLWYVTLGNLAFCARGNASCNLQGAGQPGWGLSNTGPFRNMQASSYWSGTEYAPDMTKAWAFATDEGAQDSEAKASGFQAVAVHAGDVAPGPVGYKFIDLTPPGFAVVNGAGGGEQVGGQGQYNTGGAGGVRALLWTGSADSVVDLHPPGFSRSTATGAAGKRQVGNATDPDGGMHAMLWAGSAASAVDLTPAGYSGAGALGADIGQQVGWGWVGSVNPVAHALVWTGSAASAVDLHPAGFANSWAWGVGDGQQVGVGGLALNGQSHALLWTGSAASAIDLHPAGFFSSSAARGVAGGQQGGFAVDHNGTIHALLWTGSAGSVVDLRPPGFAASQARAVAGGQQAGVAWLSASPVAALYGGRAIVWTGSAQSAVNLHNFLSPFFSLSSAEGIDDAGNIVGHAGHVNPCRYGFCVPSSHAILWVPVLPYGLDITESASPNPVRVGEQITFRITVTNRRAGTVTGVRVADTIGWTLTSATADKGSCSGTTSVTCDLGALPGGSAAHIDLVVQVPPGLVGQYISNTASVDADDLIATSATADAALIVPADLTGSWQSATQRCTTRRAVTTCTINGILHVRNQGAGTAGASVARLYLSDDTSVDARDILLGEVAIPALGAGKQVFRAVSLPVPAGGSASGKFVIAVLDASGVVQESNETNNNIATARIH